MVKVLKDEEFPADLVLFKSDKESGIVFVDTMNLDGEVRQGWFHICLD
jgi:magnesium-transporting ATPase (P-type)